MSKDFYAFDVYEAIPFKKITMMRIDFSENVDHPCQANILRHIFEPK